jgi:uncharacterized membrane protein (DUF4010 family)
MVAPALLGAAFIAWGFRRAGTETQEADGTANPLQFRSALQMALLFQLVLFGVTAVRQRWGDTGILWSGLMLGLTDMDALVISMAKQARDHEQISNAAVSTVVGTLSNTAMKLGLAAAFGSDRFRALAVGGLTGLGAATVAFFLLLR